MQRAQADKKADKKIGKIRKVEGLAREASKAPAQRGHFACFPIF